MRILKASTLAGAMVVLALAAQSTAATVSTDYTVGSTAVPGVDTGLVLDGDGVTVTATGSVCPSNNLACVGPDGNPAIDTTQSSFGGFLLPGAPAWGLVGRVGSGPWVHVGSGPTALSGTGALQFAVNDDLYSDNRGSFLVTVVSGSDDCYPGHGYGDANHDHTGPPGLDPDGCYPGHGYGDANHDHTGPPGLESGNGNAQANGHSEGKAKGRP
jgi:hypothetical protein